MHQHKVQGRPTYRVRFAHNASTTCSRVLLLLSANCSSAISYRDYRRRGESVDVSLRAIDKQFRGRTTADTRFKTATASNRASVYDQTAQRITAGNNTGNNRQHVYQPSILPRLGGILRYGRHRQQTERVTLARTHNAVYTAYHHAATSFHGRTLNVRTYHGIAYR